MIFTLICNVQFLPPPPFIPMTFQAGFFLWCFSTASVVFFYFLQSYGAKLHRVNNLGVLRVQSRGCSVSFPSWRGLPRQAGVPDTVGSSACCLCWADSGASLLAAESCLCCLIMFLNCLLYCFCASRVMSGNILHIFFF